jgi:Cell division protein CrgA
MAASGSSGRFTPKGGNPGVTGSDAKAKVDGKDSGEKQPAYANSGRYTPRTSAEEIKAMEETKAWVPWLMGFFLVLGLIIIILNYFNLLPGKSSSNWYLLVGLVSITFGFVTATQLK